MLQTSPDAMISLKDAAHKADEVAANAMVEYLGSRDQLHDGGEEMHDFVLDSLSRAFGGFSIFDAVPDLDIWRLHRIWTGLSRAGAELRAVWGIESTLSLR